MRRLGIYAHYDEHSEIKRYVLHSLAGLRAVCDRIVLVSTSALADSEKAKLAGLADDVLVRDNVGYDFAMWQTGLEREGLFDGRGLAEFDSLVLMNSSVLGPVCPLAPIFERMERADVDFWGPTESHEIAWHLQSYFLVFQRKLIHDRELRRFWSGVLPYRNKNQVIRSYEVGMTQYFADCGFKGAAAFPESTLPSFTWRRILTTTQNPTTLYPVELLEAGMPFFKLAVLRDNPGKVPPWVHRRALERTGYDMSLVEYSRRTYDKPDARR